MTKGLRQRAVTIFNHVIDSSAFLAGIILILIMLAVDAQVVSRYFFNRPILGVLEFSEIGLLYITFLGAAWLLKKEGHVKIEMMLVRFKPRHQTVINIITSVICVIILLIITWYGSYITFEHYRQGIYRVSLLHTPTAPVLLIIPVGSFMLSIQFLRRTYGFIKKLENAA